MDVLRLTEKAARDTIYGLVYLRRETRCTAVFVARAMRIAPSNVKSSVVKIAVCRSRPIAYAPHQESETGNADLICLLCLCDKLEDKLQYRLFSDDGVKTDC